MNYNYLLWHLLFYLHFYFILKNYVFLNLFIKHIAVYICILIHCLLIQQEFYFRDNYGNNKLKLLIDTDAGTDDAFALFYFLRAEKIAKFHNRTYVNNFQQLLNVFIFNLCLTIKPVMHVLEYF